jgi:PAS domain S-box-containing protein
MKIVEHLPLRQKLTWLAMTCSVVALLVAAVALGTYEWVAYRHTMYAHLTTLTELTARNSAAAVAFTNAEDATRILAALETERTVVAAVLYDERGRRLAEFRRPGVDVEVQRFTQLPDDGLQSAGPTLQLTVPVAEAKRFGTLTVVADLRSLHTRLLAYGFMLLCTTVVSGLLAYLLTGWLKERIVGPIQALAAAADHVQRRGDYSIRVPKTADDEVGALTDAFNAMLVRIEQNEAEIARGAERLRLAVDAAKVGTWDWDLLQDSMHWNPRAYEIFGVASGTMVTAAVFYRMIHPEDEPRVRGAIEKALLSSAEFTFDFRVLWGGKSDAVHHIAMRGRFIRTEGGPRRGVGVIVDTTERRMAELRAIESERRFRAVVERAPAMIWSCDQNLERDYFNRTWLTFTGRPIERETGRGWQEGVPRADFERWQEVARAATAQHDPYSVEYRLRRADGSLRWVVETAAPRFAADGQFIGYLGSCTDITTRKENETELETHVRQRTSELQAANQDLESFSYSVSHDLRGPVRAIQGFAEIAKEEIDANALSSARDRIDRVLKAADRMNKLIDAFIGMARISRAELKMEPVNLTRLAEEVVGFLRLTHPDRNIEIVVAPALEANGDERLLRIALENLFSNAWKFTARQPVAKVEFGSFVRQSEQIFFVRDNGAGFDPALSHKLFHAFERLHPGSQFEGLGVGLNTVARVVQKHGGRVWAESVAGQGATFYFTLSSAAPAVGASREPFASAALSG